MSAKQLKRLEMEGQHPGDLKALRMTSIFQLIKAHCNERVSA